MSRNTAVQALEELLDESIHHEAELAEDVHYARRSVRSVIKSYRTKKKNYIKAREARIRFAEDVKALKKGLA